MNYKWLLQVHKHARCSRKLSATASDSSGPAVVHMLLAAAQMFRQWLEQWQELPAPLTHLHPAKDGFCHQADHRHDCQVLSSSGPTHSLFVAHGTIWPQGPHQPPLLFSSQARLR